MTNRASRGNKKSKGWVSTSIKGGFRPKGSQKHIRPKLTNIVQKAVSRALHGDDGPHVTDGMIASIPSQGKALVAIQRQAQRGGRKVKTVIKDFFHPDETIIQDGLGAAEQAYSKIDDYNLSIEKACEKMSPYAFACLQEGRGKGMKHCKATDYLGIPHLTAMCEQRKNRTDTEPTLPGNETRYNYTIQASRLENVQNKITKDYKFDISGGMYNFIQPKNPENELAIQGSSFLDWIHVSNLEHYFKHISLLEYITDLKRPEANAATLPDNGVFKFEGYKRAKTEEKIFQERRLVLSANLKTIVKEYIADQMKQALGNVYDLNKFQKETDYIIDKISSEILESWKKNSNITFGDARIRSFSSSDYEINLCSINGVYDFKASDKQMQIAIVRRMTLSSVSQLARNESKKQYNIPLCEEISIQLRGKNERETYSNTPRGLVIALKLGADPSCVHFHGLNAFTLKIPTQIPWRENRHECSMQIAGWLVQHIDYIHSLNEEHKASALDVFGGIIKPIQRLIADRINSKRLLTGKKDMITTVDKDTVDPQGLYRLLELSFLGNQSLSHLSSLTGKSDHAKCISPPFVVTQWFCAPSFSIVVLSPNQKGGAYGKKKAHTTTVMCITHDMAHTPPTTGTEHTELETLFDPSTEAAKTTSIKKDIAPLFQESSLPLELELELKLL